MAKKKDNTVIIQTLGDAVELVNHNSEAFDRSIKKLMKTNRRLKFFNVFIVCCAIYLAADCYKQEEELYKLSIRVKKLENNEGE